jgi:hypothetical protein
MGNNYRGGGVSTIDIKKKTAHSTAPETGAEGGKLKPETGKLKEEKRRETTTKCAKTREKVTLEVWRGETSQRTSKRFALLR